MNGFTVRPEDLQAASNEVHYCTERIDQAIFDVSDELQLGLIGSAAGSAIEEICVSWRAWKDQTVADTRQFAKNLISSLEAYQEIDRELASSFRRLDGQDEI